MANETQAPVAAEVKADPRGEVKGPPGVTYVKVDLPPVPPEMLKTTRVYEVLILLDPPEATKGWNPILEMVKGYIEGRHGGLVLKVENWGDSKKLAYEVEGLRRGTYMLIFFRAKPTTINALDTELRFEDKIVRHMIVHHEKMPDALTGRVRVRVADEYEDDDFRGRRDDDWDDDDGFFDE